MNRNRIIHPTKPEDLYITVPLTLHKRDTAINEITIKSDKNYIERIMGHLSVSYKKGPCILMYHGACQGLSLLGKISLSSLNVRALNGVCKYIGIPFNYEVFSEMNLMIDEVSNAGDGALNISKVLGADEYVNPPGGVGVFYSDKFGKENVKLTFLQNNLTPYNQKKAKFIPELSIIDVMMFNSP